MATFIYVASLAGLVLSAVAILWVLGGVVLYLYTLKNQ